MLQNPFELLRSSKRKLRSEEALEPLPQVVSHDIPSLQVPAPMPLQADIATSQSYQSRKLADTVVLIGLRCPNTFAFSGRCMLSVIKGSASVLGHQMDSNSAAVPCYSPNTHANLIISSKPLLDESCAPISDFDDDFDTILRLESLTDGFDGLDYSLPGWNIWKHSSDNSSRQIISGVFVTTSNAQILSIPPVWNDLAGNFLSNVEFEAAPCFAVCGSKNTGKSTFCRFLLNSALQSHDSVCYLETDVGQSEFTPAGLLSLNLLTKPVIGPSFTHMDLQHTRSFGFTTPEQEPSFYFSCFLSLLQVYKSQYQKFGIPLVINTHGWIRGVGNDLLMQILLYARPNFVLQFVPSTATGELNTSDVVLNDLKSELKTEWFEDSVPPVTEAELQAWNPNIIFLPPASDSSSATKSRFTSHDYRSLSLMSYFARKGDVYDFTPITSTIPYFVPASAVKAVVCSDLYHETDLLNVMNANLFAILDPASVDKSSATVRRDTNLLSCTNVRALGIARGINASEPAPGLFVVAPLPLDQLNQDSVALLSRFHYDLPLCMMFQSQSFRTGPYTEGKALAGVIGHSVRKVRRNLQRKNKFGAFHQ